MSSIVAFAVGKKYQPGGGVYMLGAHTDSPCLKVKPVGKGKKSGFAMVNVETYGGGLWTTWFDRDLSVAGRILIRAPGGKLEQKLVRSNACSLSLYIRLAAY
jgi:aspartyl aminopeptidase